MTVMLAAPVALYQTERAGDVAQLHHSPGSAVRLTAGLPAGLGAPLIEDVPGVGKTTLSASKPWRRSVHCDFHRLQCTSGHVPSDVLGVTIYNAHTQVEFKQGRCSQISRSPIEPRRPQTQSALLEAMNEMQGDDRKPFVSTSPAFAVMATQNPVEHHGTYPLPESQLDRFLMRIRIGYPDRGAEREILRNTDGAQGGKRPARTVRR